MNTNPYMLSLLTVATQAAAIHFSTPAAFAQEPEEALPAALSAPTENPQTHFALETGVAGQGGADIDGGGEMQVTRFDAGLLFTTQISEHAKLASLFLLGANDYDFDGGVLTIPGERWFSTGSAFNSAGP
jgi:hypothetical protein